MTRTITQGGNIGGADRGCVWDKVATEWAGDEDWACERARCQTVEDKKRFVTFELTSVNQTTIQ